MSTISSDDTPHEQPHHHDHPDTGHDVTVTINGVEKEIPRGSYRVSELKDKLGVAAALELDLVVAGQFKFLPDGDRITITGGEIFVSHVRGGGSS
ncbi:MAG: hypothetical protein ACYDDA_00395 [Acidiferrobacteraceae bacterium]